jgi:gas vesicle protein
MSEENKKQTISEQAESIRKDLEDLLGPDENIDVEQDPSDLPVPKFQTAKPLVNYDDMKGISDKQAKKTINSLMRFYLDADIIEKDEYLQAKKKMDEMTMGSLVYQLKAGERALTTLLETIEGGELAPRMFEVLATLQKSMLDIIKSQTMYLMATEESAKRIARDIELYKKRDRDDDLEQVGGKENGNIQRGTKDLMNQIQAGIQQADIEDIEPEDE